MDYKEYREEVFDDIIQYIEDAGYLVNFENPDPFYRWGDNDFDNMMDEIEPVVTGEDNGSYYCNSFKAKKALKGVVLDQDAMKCLDNMDMLDSFFDYIKNGYYEYADVALRIAIFYNIQPEVKEWIEKVID